MCELEGVSWYLFNTFFALEYKENIYFYFHVGVECKKWIVREKRANCDVIMPKLSTGTGVLPMVSLFVILRRKFE